MLINAKTLACHLSSYIILDCRHNLLEEGKGRACYLAGHIPGAHHLDLDQDLSGIVNGSNGRHPLPDPEKLALTFSSLGINHHTHIVVYDEITGPFAARCWWLLHWLGIDNVMILDGGYAAWQALGYVEDREIPSKHSTQFRPNVREDMVAMISDIEDTSHLIDARQSARWRGEVEPIDAVKGRIPNALNHPFENNLTPQGFLRHKQDLHDNFTAFKPTSETIHYCGSGVSACHNMMSLAVAGLPLGKLYAGSWSEWCADKTRRIACGE